MAQCIENLIEILQLKPITQRHLDEIHLAVKCLSDFNELDQNLRLFKRLIAVLFQELSCNCSALIDVLKLIRICFRNQTLVECTSLEDVDSISAVIHNYAGKHLNSQYMKSNSSIHSIIVDGLAIILKLTNIEMLSPQLFATSILLDVLQLMSSSNSIVVKCCINIVNKLVPYDRKAFLSKNYIEILVHLLLTSSVPVKILAANVILELSIDKSSLFFSQMKTFDAVAVLINGLQCVDDLKYKWSVVNTLIVLLEDDEITLCIINSGGIPILLNELSIDSYDKVSISYVSALLTFISDFAMNNYFCKLLVDADAVYLIMKCVVHINLQCLNSLSLTDMNARTFKAHRIIYSHEKNRTLYAKIFSIDDIFQKFVDFGNFNTNLTDYKRFSSALNISTWKYMRDNLNECLRKTVCKDLYTIGDYDILEILGSGGFGSVFKAKRHATNSQVDSKIYAIKRITTLRQNNINSLHNEIAILKEQLSHPNIVRYYQSFTDESHFYILMEYIDGLSLAEHLNGIEQRNKRTELPWIRAVMIQLVQGLCYLHNIKRIVHRDLTPNNILITSGENRVKIADFGLSRLCAKNGMLTSAVGTVSYWCPEMMHGVPYDERADIWSLGCILYQMCTLKPPFSSSNMLALAKKICECEYDKLSSDHFPDDIISVVENCICLEQRSCISDVCKIIGPQILEAFDLLSVKHFETEKKYECERTRYYQLATATRLVKTPENASPNSSFPDLTITARKFSPSRVREISSDPILQVINILRQLEWICNQPVSPELFAARSLVQYYKWYMYNALTDLEMKSELQMILQRSDCLLAFSDKYRQLTKKARQEMKNAGWAVESVFTYAQMRQMIDFVLNEMGYSEGQ